MASGGQAESARAIELGSVEEASIVLARLLSVTQAGYERSAHLQRALNSRIVIEQAKGVLAERFAIDVEDAFPLLRRAARSSGQRIHALAQSVVSSRDTPPPITAELAKSWTPSANAESD